MFVDEKRQEELKSVDECSNKNDHFSFYGENCPQLNYGGHKDDRYSYYGRGYPQPNYGDHSYDEESYAGWEDGNHFRYEGGGAKWKSKNYFCYASPKWKNSDRPYCNIHQGVKCVNSAYVSPFVYDLQ